MSAQFLLGKEKKKGGNRYSYYDFRTGLVSRHKKTNKYHQKLPGNPSKMGANIPK